MRCVRGTTMRVQSTVPHRASQEDRMAILTASMPPATATWQRGTELFSMSYETYLYSSSGCCVAVIDLSHLATAWRLTIASAALYFSPHPPSSLLILALFFFSDNTFLLLSSPLSFPLITRDAIEGEFPRAISLFRTSQSYIAQARENVPDILSMVWFGQYAPGKSHPLPPRADIIGFHIFYCIESCTYHDISISLSVLHIIFLSYPLMQHFMNYILSHSPAILYSIFRLVKLHSPVCGCQLPSKIVDNRSYARTFIDLVIAAHFISFCLDH